MTNIIRVKFKSPKHREDFANIAWYNKTFEKFMPEEFLAEFRPNSRVQYILVDVDGKKIELPESEGGDGITFDDEEFHLFMEQIK
ncbi:hypothetical protein Asfd1_64 [Aeromonas phage Asfd_1]|nr:hypothetical protein Asfd1_64 [Aeromonas phage Asfd_1]